MSSPPSPCQALSCARCDSSAPVDGRDRLGDELVRLAGHGPRVVDEPQLQLPPPLPQPVGGTIGPDCPDRHRLDRAGQLLLPDVLGVLGVPGVPGVRVPGVDGHGDRYDVTGVEVGAGAVGGVRGVVVAGDLGVGVVGEAIR